ncbi:MAG: hypothetical protein WBP08_19415 [Saprospiraceae bacterium]
MNFIRKTAILLNFALLSTVLSFGQAGFKATESDLAYYSDVMVSASEGKHRAIAMEKFNELFIKTLNQKGAYQYPFDSLKWISKKSPDDKSFRIFTWEVEVADGDYKYFGALQNADNKLFILQDNFKNTEGGLKDEEFNQESWLGALYYNLMDCHTTKGEKYYLLFGINRWNKFENIKLVDVLFFTNEGVPYFGKPVFHTKVNGEKNDVFYRLVFKYASDAQMTLNYNPGMEMIVLDNLVKKMSRIPGQGETLVPDGSYIGYEMKDGNWIRIDKIATQIMDEAPRPVPVLDKRKGKKINGN